MAEIALRTVISIIEKGYLDMQDVRDVRLCLTLFTDSFPISQNNFRFKSINFQPRLKTPQ